MKILSLRGVGGAHKKIALKRCVVNYKPYVVSNQETVCEGSKVEAIYSSCLRDWSFCSLNAEDKSGGLVTRWNSSKELIQSSFQNANIKTELESKQLEKVFSIV
jgi:hypothetical protein